MAEDSVINGPGQEEHDLAYSITNLQKLSRHHRNSALSVMKVLFLRTSSIDLQLFPGSGEKCQ